IMGQALEKARKGRLHILKEIGKVLPTARPDLSQYAPRIFTMQIKPDKIGDEDGEKARAMVAAITTEPEVGRTYEGPVKSTTAFGAFVEILPGVEGLLHISELQHGRTEKTEDVVKKGDIV